MREVGRIFDVMRAIEGAYRDRPADVEKTASQLVNI